MRINCQHALLMVLLSLTAQVHAFTWQDLWATKDQQGQALMDKGQFKEANDTFIRPDWRAASAFRASDYEQAAKLFSSNKSEDSYYNQGNALAYLGKYQEAINAYDKTLAINPENKDALHNRKILEKLLKKEKQQQNQQDQDKQNQDKQNQDKQNQDKQNQDKQNQDKQNQDKQNQDKQNQDKQNQDKQNQDKQNQDKQNHDKQNQDKQNQDKQNQDKQNQDKQNQDKQNQDKQNQDKQNQDKQNQDKQNQDKQNQDKQKQDKQKQDKQDSSKQNAQAGSKHEQQQAKEQWLRLIPDDPGGLLREKFLRDHLRRQDGWD
jgi:Ca-activated chloride channel family protein